MAGERFFFGGRGAGGGEVRDIETGFSFLGRTELFLNVVGIFFRRKESAKCWIFKSYICKMGEICKRKKPSNSHTSRKQNEMLNYLKRLREINIHTNFKNPQH